MYSAPVVLFFGPKPTNLGGQMLTCFSFINSRSRACLLACLFTYLFTCLFSQLRTRIHVIKTNHYHATIYLLINFIHVSAQQDCRVALLSVCLFVCLFPRDMASRDVNR